MKKYKYIYVICFAFAARVVTDRVSGYSKGFGFVRYATLEDAAAGIKGLDGQVSCDIRLPLFLLVSKFTCT